MVAYYDATPHGGKKSRREMLGEAELELPEVEHYAYLIEYLSELGWQCYNGMGAMPITWQELESWRNTTATYLSRWDAHALRILSSNYVGEKYTAEQKGAMPPWRPYDTPAPSLDKRLKDAFSRFKTKDKRRGR